MGSIGEDLPDSINIRNCKSIDCVINTRKEGKVNEMGVGYSEVDLEWRDEVE